MGPLKVPDPAGWRLSWSVCQLSCTQCHQSQFSSTALGKGGATSPKCQSQKSWDQLFSSHNLGAAVHVPTSPGPALQHYHGEIRGLLSQVLPQVRDTAGSSSVLGMAHSCPCKQGQLYCDAQVRSGASSPDCGRQQVSEPSLPHPHHHRAGEV